MYFKIFNYRMSVFKFPCILNVCCQVSLLSRMFCDCGRDLEAADVVAMQELVDVAKDAFLKEKNNIKIRTQLMLMVETHASNWQLSEAAKKFYSTRH